MGEVRTLIWEKKATEALTASAGLSLALNSNRQAFPACTSNSYILGDACSWQQTHTAVRGGCSSRTSGVGKRSGCPLPISCRQSLELECSCVAMHGRLQACKETSSVRGSGMREAERLAPTLLPFSTAVMMLLISSSTLRVPRIRSSTLRA